MLRNFGLMLTRAIHQGCIKAVYSWRTFFIILALHEKHILISPCPPHQNQPLETGPVYGNIKITSFPMGMLRKAFGSRSSEVDRHGSTIQLRSADQCRSQGPRSPQQKFVLTRINYVTDYINNTTKQRGGRVCATSGGQKLISVCIIASMCGRQVWYIDVKKTAKLQQCLRLVVQCTRRC